MLSRFGGRSHVQDNTRLLNVEVVSANGFAGTTKRGKSADSYIRLVLWNDATQKVTKEDYTTTVRKDTLAPVWNEKFVIGTKYSVESQSDLRLNFTMGSKGTFSLSETAMGQFNVDLTNIDPSGKIVDLEYPLQDHGRAIGVTGSVKVKLWFSRLPMDFTPVAVGNPLAEGVEGGEVAAGDPDVLMCTRLGFRVDSENAVDMPPNELQIMIIQAKGVLAMDTAIFAANNTSDPYCQIQLQGSSEASSAPKMKTKVISKCLEPVWNQSFSIPIKSADASVNITMFDKNVGFDKFMGGITVPLSQFVDKKPFRTWYTLLAEGGKNDGVQRGQLEIALRWGVNMDLANRELKGPSAMGRVGAFLGIGSGAGYDSAPEDEDKETEEFDFGDGNGGTANAEQGESEEEAKKRKAEDLEKQKLLEEISITTGDWSIQVHLIEARDLKAENYDGTSDPIVYVEVFGQRQQTQVIYGQTSCVFDELLIFNMKNLDKDQFTEGIIRVSVMDYNTLKNTMIGAVAFDCANIYQSNRDHELYRQWTALMDDVDPDDVGVQGYLKLSVTIVGPGEKVKVHDLDAEMDAEIKRENEAGEDLSSLLLPSPTMRKEWVYIVARIYKCEGLPIMDGKTMGIYAAGTDAFCTLSFAGGKKIKTKVKTIKSENRMAISPIFEYELWYPIAIPSMTTIAKVNVWDFDDKGPEFIGQAIAKYSEIKKLPGQTLPARWYNFYGAHEYKDDSAFNNIKKTAGGFKKAIKRLGGVEINWYKFYNNVPERAAAYRGRGLISWSVESTRPGKYATAEIIPFRRKISPLPVKSYPQTAEYILQALVIAGTELPYFTSLSSIGYAQKLRVRIVIGIDELCTDAAKFEKGMCRWNQFLKSGILKYPVDIDQIPDIFVYLVNEADRPVCYTRMKPFTVYPKASLDSEGRAIDKVELKGFMESTKWALLEEDKALDALDAGEFPGTLLLKVGFGLATESARMEQEWQTCLKEAKTSTQYQARIHIYQGRNMPSADSNGLCDPFVCVNFMGHRKTTKVVYKTLYPTWYETIIIDNVSLPEANNFEYASQVNFRIYDNDLPLLPGQKRPTLSDEYVGMTQYPLNQALVCDLDVPTSDFPDPFWKSMFLEAPGDSMGDILVLVQLIKTNGRNLPDKIPSPIPEELSIIPASRDAFIELIILGCRDLAAFNFRPMVSPFLEMSLDSLGTSYATKTQQSKIPHPSNPNFLQRIVLPVRLPEKSIYASPLSIKVRDCRLGGYLKPVVGVGAIALSTKIPWCPETYIPPAMDIYIAQEGAKNNGNPSLAKDAEALAADEKAYQDQLASLEAEALYEAQKAAAEAAIFDPNQDDSEDEEEYEDHEAAQLLDGMEGGHTMFDDHVQRSTRGSTGLKAGGLDSSARTRSESQSSRRHHRISMTKRLSMKAQGGVSGTKRDEVSSAIEEMRTQRKLDLLHDDYLVQPEPPSVDSYINQRKTEVDSGAGVFGGLQHITIKGGTKEEKEANVFSDPDWTQDDGDLPPDWSIGRVKMDSELETDFKTTPFETYEFVRGKQGKSGKLFGHSFKVVGKLKGLVRVMESENDPPMFPQDIMDMLLKPKAYKVRLYVLRATNLTGMDLDMFGNIAKSDPYLKVTLGKFCHNDRKNAVDDVTDVDIYQMIEINAELPGTSQLQIELMDKDTIGSDDLIGKTIIDLEDRWFDTRWQQLGEENMILPGNDVNDETRIRWKTKPIERRTLHVPSSTAGQGIVEMWVDIMSPEESQSFPPDDVALPPVQVFEVRMVVWKARDVPPMDALEGMSDLFVKAWPEGCAPQETDTHWRAKKGKASWNYRLLFDVELGHNTRAMKFPYLYVQLWDRDILKWNDCAGEVTYNLGKYYRKAFKRNIALKLFEKKSGMQATRERKAVKTKKPKVDDIGDVDMVVEEEGDVAAGPSTKSSKSVEYPDSSRRLPGDDKIQMESNPSTHIPPSLEHSASTKGVKPAIVSQDDDSEDDSDEDDTSSLLGRAKEAGKTKAQLEAEEDEEEEMKETVDSFKNMTGIWDIDPPDCDWVHLQKKDHNTDKVVPMGSVAISLQLWPKEKAIAMPSGAARNDPNSNPFLPPPVGRIKWSWNPFVLGAELCGPKLCGYFTCCLFCTAFILLMIFCQPFLNIIINLIFVVFPG